MITSSLSAHKKLFTMLAVCWTVLIAVMCLISFSDMPKVSLQSADKYVHFTFHFVFTVLWFLALYGINKKGLLLTVLLFSFGYGILIEIMQGLFTLTRRADVYDVMANTAGAAFAVLLLWCCENYPKRKA